MSGIERFGMKPSSGKTPLGKSLVYCISNSFFLWVGVGVAAASAFGSARPSRATSEIMVGVEGKGH